MAHQPLTVIAPIKPGEEAALRKILDTITADLANNPFLQIARSQTTHFLRLAIMSDADYGHRLLMTSNYDGNLADYLENLLSLGPEIAQIWNKCAGYEEASSLEEFIRARSYRAQAAYTAIQGETVNSIRQRIELREKLEQFLDLNAVSDFVAHCEPKRLLRDLSQLKTPLNLWQLFGGMGHQIWRWLKQLPIGLSELLRLVALGVVRLIGSAIGAPERARLAGEYIGVDVDFERLRMLNELEVVHGTNHLHLLSTVRPGRLFRLRIVLFLVNIAGRHLFPPGSLSDIRSIHFAHWSIVDKGKHLLFVTHFDGSFDNYLGDFADRASDGLNSIWNNVVGYPQAGAFDIVAFKQFFRNDQQSPSQVFFRAYPNTSVVNILRDRAIVQPLANSLQPSVARDWLGQL